MRSLRLLLLLGTLAFAARLAPASTVYFYVGNDFQYADNSAGAWASTSEYITGWFTVAAPLPANSLLNLTPLDWSLSDGLHTLDPSTLNVDSFALTIFTDANADFSNWSFLAAETGSGVDGTSGMTLATIAFPGMVQDLSSGVFADGASTAFNLNSPGVWSSTTIPEPGTLALAASGAILLLAGLRKRRRES